MFETIRSTQELLASFHQQPTLQKLDYYDDLMAQYSSMEAQSAAGDSENFSLKDYAHQYIQMRDTYLDAAKALKMASGPYKASRDAYVAAGVCPGGTRARGTLPHAHTNPPRNRWACATRGCHAARIRAPQRSPLTRATTRNPAPSRPPRLPPPLPPLPPSHPPPPVRSLDLHQVAVRLRRWLPRERAQRAQMLQAQGLTGGAARGGGHPGRGVAGGAHTAGEGEVLSPGVATGGMPSADVHVCAVTRVRTVTAHTCGGDFKVVDY